MGNEFSPQDCFVQMGTIMRRFGYRAALSGKWHLDGAGYHGNGEVGGGFEEPWWFDGKRFLDGLGHDRQQQLIQAISGGIGVSNTVTPEMGAQMRAHNSAEALRTLQATEADIWGHGVADRCIDFMEQTGDDPFVLVASFDEPHGPFITPPEWREHFTVDDLPMPDNYKASLADKPRMQQRQAEEFTLGWEDYAAWRLRHARCNAMWMKGARLMPSSGYRREYDCHRDD